MKKIQVKIDGEWREVIYVRGGYVDMHQDIDGTFASLRLKPKERGSSEGCTFTAIQDIRLVDNCEDESVRCNICDAPPGWEHKPNCLVLDIFEEDASAYYGKSVKVDFPKYKPPVDESEEECGCKETEHGAITCERHFKPKPKIEKLDLKFSKQLDCYTINEMRHEDSRIDLLAEKINEIIEKLA